jgi:hypothetical protein
MALEGGCCIESFFLKATISFQNGGLICACKVAKEKINRKRSNLLFIV